MARSGLGTRAPVAYAAANHRHSLSLPHKKHNPNKRKDKTKMKTAMPLPRATPCTPPEQLARKRAEHARRRLRELRTICPDLPDDVLARTSLRTLSVAVRRAGRRAPAQTSLKTDAQTVKSQHCPAAPERNTPSEAEALPTS